MPPKIDSQGPQLCKYSGKSIRQQVYVKHRIVVVDRPRSNSLAGSVSSEGIPPESVYPPLKCFPKLPFWPWVIFKNGYTKAEGSGSHPASAPHRRRVEPSDGYWLFPVRAPGSDAHPTAQPPLENSAGLLGHVENARRGIPCVVIGKLVQERVPAESPAWTGTGPE